MKQGTLYFVAAALFAVAAGINVSKNAEFGLRIAFYFVAVVALVWLGIRQRRVGS